MGYWLYFLSFVWLVVVRSALGDVTECYVGAYPLIGYPTISMGVNDTALYELTSLPVNGTITYNGTDLELSEIVGNLSLLKYESSEAYVFSVNAATVNCTASDVYYDTFELLIRQFVSTNGTSDYGQMIQTTHSVSVCLVDVQDVPVAEDLKVAVIDSDVVFNVTVQDEDDRTGESDGLLSTFSFHNESGGIAAGSGVYFNVTNTTIGSIYDSTCSGSMLDPGTAYNSVEFCFVKHASVDGKAYVSYGAVDKGGGTSLNKTIEFNTRDILVCNDGRSDDSQLASSGACAIYQRENESILAANVSAFVPFKLPTATLSALPFTYSLRILSIPAEGELLLLPNQTEVLVGDILSKDDELVYVNRVFYYNRYFYPNYSGGFATFMDESNQTIDGCEDSINGCLDYVSYEAYGTGDVSGLVSSLPGRVNLVVEREIIDNMTVCPLNGLSPWPREPCISYGEERTYIPIFLIAFDGRSVPAYRINITSLPVGGVLYYTSQNLSTEGEYVPGNEVQIGDIILPVALGVPNLLYLGDVAYYNRYGLDVLPLYEYALTNDHGEYLNGCLPENINTTDCTDFFTYYAYSGINASDVSEQGEYRIAVARPKTDQLIVCGSNGYSPWNLSCTSVGYESNDLWDDYPIPIHLNVENTFGDAVTYTIIQKPLKGYLYRNIGNDTDVEYGDLVENITGIYYTPRGSEIPDFLYVGWNNYYNDIDYEANEEVTYVDRNGVLIGSCLDALVKGCPDYLLFQANASDGRRSNIGRYETYVHSQTSVIILAGPSEAVYTPGVRFYFANSTAIEYFDPDEYIYYVWVTVKIWDGAVGFVGSMENLTFPSTTAYACFNTTGCEDFVEFYAFPPDIRKVFETFFYLNNETEDSTDKDSIELTIIKRLPDGMTIDNAFTHGDEEVSFELDIPYYTNALEEYEAYIEDGSEYYDNKKLEVAAERDSILLYVILALVGVLAVFVVYWAYRYRRTALASDANVPTAIRVEPTAKGKNTKQPVRQLARPLHGQLRNRYMWNVE
jgi:hypothetical protein